MSSESYHEPYDALAPATRDAHRAIVTLMEELEAIDWYQQRADVCHDDELRAVLVHNKDEEIEHAMMVLEWLRRKVPVFDENIRTYLSAEGPITEIEAKAEAAASGGAQGGSRESGSRESGSRESGSRESGSPARSGPAPGASGSLGIGSLKEG